MSDFTDTPFFAAPPMDDDVAAGLVRSAMSIIGSFPRRSLVLLFIEGDTAGPCLRADIPYEVHDPDEWVSGLLAEIPEEYCAQPAVLMCFEDAPQAEPEWFHRIFLAIKRGLDHHGIHSPELMWIASSAGRHNEDSSGLQDISEGETGRRILETVESVVPETDPGELATLERTLRPLLETAEKRLAVQTVLAPQRQGETRPRGQEHEFCESGLSDASFSLGGCLRRRPADELDQASESRDEETEPNLIECILLVESLDLLLTRARHGSALAAELQRSSAPLVLVAEHLSSVLGTELIARTALCGRRAAMAMIQRRFRTHDDLERAFRELPRYRSSAEALAEEMVDGPPQPSDPTEWVRRLSSIRPTDFLGGEEANLLECLPDPRSSVISYETHARVLAESGFSDAIFTDVSVCHWEDLEALAGLCLLLSRCTPPFFSRRLVGVALWSLWARGEGTAAADYASLTRSVLGEDEDPVVRFVEMLWATDVTPAAYARFPRGEEAF